MREILYRGKTEDGRWVYGYLVKQFGIYKIYDDTKENYGDWICEVDPATLGQYIPKEGFYEGDILYGQETDEYGALMSSWIGEVKYDENAGRIRVLDDAGDWYETDDYSHDKVIGNIHDKEVPL